MNVNELSVMEYMAVGLTFPSERGTIEVNYLINYRFFGNFMINYANLWKTWM